MITQSKNAAKTHNVTREDSNAYPAKFASVRRFLWANRSSACRVKGRISTTATRDSCRGTFSWGRCRRRGSTAWWCRGPCREQRTASATCLLSTSQYPSPSRRPSRCPTHTLQRHFVRLLINKTLLPFGSDNFNTRRGIAALSDKRILVLKSHIWVSETDKMETDPLYAAKTKTWHDITYLSHFFSVI